MFPHVYINKKPFTLITQFTIDKKSYKNQCFFVNGFVKQSCETVYKIKKYKKLFKNLLTF